MDVEKVLSPKRKLSSNSAPAREAGEGKKERKRPRKLELNFVPIRNEEDLTEETLTYEDIEELFSAGKRALETSTPLPVM